MQPIGGKRLRNITNPMPQPCAQPEIPIHEIVVVSVEVTDILDHRSPDKGGRLRDGVFTAQHKVFIIEATLRFESPDRRPISQRILSFAKYNPNIRMPR